MGTLQKLAERWGLSPEGRARRLRAECNAVGTDLAVEGSPIVENEGTITLGRGVTVNARFAPTRLKVGPGGLLRIGDEVDIGFGSVLSASLEISIGNRVTLGPYVFVVDANMGDPDLGAESSGAVPIVIGDDVELGSRVTVLKGSRIGQGARIMAGSVVAGAIPPYSVASGNPAQVLRAARPRLVHELLSAAASLHPDKPAVISGAQELSYKGLCRRAGAIGAALAGAGVKAGDPVLILTTTKADFIAAFYGTLELGAVAVPVPEGAARATVTDLAQASGARVIVTDGPILATFSPPLDEKDFTLVRLENVAAGASSPRTAQPVEPRTPALIMFTSGTTAKKKAVLLSHQNLVQATININEFIKIDERVREFVAVPLYHSFGLGRVRAVLAVGGTLVLNDGHLNPAAMIQTIESKRANALSTVPAGLSMFSGKLEAPLRRIGPQIEVIELGSAFMSPDEKARLLDVFPRARVCMHYGLTEASRSTFLEFRRESQKLSTVGRPSPNVIIEIHDPEGRVRPAGEQGEIVVRGAHVTLGYFRDEERTSAAFTPDGAFRTGDFGFLDAEGYLHLLGRKDEIINKGGIKISPLELEEKLSEAYPDVEMCVVGVPDPTGLAGEIPVLAYTGQVDLALADVLLALSQRVERNKLPHSIVKVESIPRTANGKPMRRVLREQLTALGVGG
jgi:long-chain acyl-CoA synthetase